MWVKKNIDKKLVSYHILYWVLFLLFFSIVWGSYDSDYYRNFMVQILSLPSRLLLVYVTLYILFPRYLQKDKTLKFTIFYILLLIFCAVVVQRTVMLFVIEGRYLPYKSEDFFTLIELTNTIMDVNIAAIIPIGSKLIGHWKKSKKKVDELQILNQKLTNDRNRFILFKKGTHKHKIFLYDIVFLESLRNKIKVVTLEKEHIFYGSISKMEEMLKEYHFLKVHRSYIVNLNYLESFSSNSICLSGKNIPIGRKYKIEVLKILKK